MGKFSWFAFCPDDFLSSSTVALMTQADIGAYILLLCHAWNDPECSLPSDPQQLAALARGTALSEIVVSCFVAHPNHPSRLANVRLLIEHKKARRWQAKSRLGGISSGKTRALPSKGGSTTLSTKDEPPLVHKNIRTIKDKDKENTLVGKAPDQAPMEADEILDFLNLRTGKHFRGRHPNGAPTSSLKLIRTLLQHGYTAVQLKQVIANRWLKWGKDAKMEEYMRPSTLFRASNFEQYVGELGKTMPDA